MPANNHIMVLLTTQIQQFVQKLLAGGNHTTVSPVLGACHHQFNEVLSNVGVTQFQRTTNHSPNSIFSGSPLNRKTGADAFRKDIQTTGFQANRVGKPGQDRVSPRFRTHREASRLHPPQYL